MRITRQKRYMAELQTVEFSRSSDQEHHCLYKLCLQQNMWQGKTLLTRSPSVVSGILTVCNSREKLS